MPSVGESAPLGTARGAPVGEMAAYDMVTRGLSRR
jgi:hypothetical protein